jgi:WD40 repeat protein
LEGHAGKINDLRFTPNSEKLLAAGGVSGRNGEIVLWDVATGKKLKTFFGHRDTVYVAIVSSSEKILASGSYDHTIMLWNFETGEVLHTLSGHNGPVFDLAFSPDTNNLVSASGDTTVKVWHVPSGRRVDTRSEPLKEQYSVDFSPDGSQLLPEVRITGFASGS